MYNEDNFSKSNQYRKEIHALIPGGAHTYSKGDDQFPSVAPAAIVKGKGSYVWDLDENKFLDCSMGLGSVTLGHAYDDVNMKVIETINNGVNFQRPSFLEREAAKSFLEVVNYHQMIKFAKNGSTVTTAAVKLARAFTKKKLVAFPYDHPFYSYDDWFIGHTACNAGVPEEIVSLSVTFKGNDIESLRELFEKYPDQIACVITEPEKFDSVSSSFLKEAVQLCHDNGALFIADEMITGFKVGFPGSCSSHGVVPDLSTWGKGIANGYSFCALTGKKEIMEIGGIDKAGSEKVFLISSTHGGETTGLAAVISTIDIFKRKDVLAHNHMIGEKIIQEASRVVALNNLGDYIKISSSKWTVAFSFLNSKSEVCALARTFFLQEMIKLGVLFQGIFVPSFSHNNVEVELFVRAFGTVCEKYKGGLNDGFEKLLIGEPCKPVFRKYN